VFVFIRWVHVLLKDVRRIQVCIKREIMHYKKKEDLSLLDAYWRTPTGIKGLWIKALRKLRQYYRKLFEKKNYIFSNEGPFEPVINSPCEFECYRRFEDITDQVREKIIECEGINSLKAIKFEMHHGALMWCGFVDGQLANYRFSRFGKYFKMWFVDLNDKDIVLFRGKTYPEFRGRGVHGAVGCYIMHVLLKNGGRAFVDCDANNISSIRANAKAGFKKIAEMRPITIEDALGVKRS
jgi:hypothetical protein